MNGLKIRIAQLQSVQFCSSSPTNCSLRWRMHSKSLKWAFEFCQKLNWCRNQLFKVWKVFKQRPSCLSVNCLSAFPPLLLPVDPTFPSRDSYYFSKFSSSAWKVFKQQQQPSCLLVTCLFLAAFPPLLLPAESTVLFQSARVEARIIFPSLESFLFWT